MRPALLLLAIACHGPDPGDKTDTGAPPVPTDTGAPPTTDTLPQSTPWTPVYFNLSAQLPIDADGDLHHVTWPNYGDVAPNLTVWMGGPDWVPGDWGDEVNVCRVVVDVSDGTPGGSWVAEDGQWWGFDAPAAPAPISDDCWDVVDGVDVYAIAAALEWSVGIGPLLPQYASQTDEYLFGGYATSPLVLYPDPLVEGYCAGRAYEVDEDTNTVVVGTDFYPVAIPADQIHLPEGGVAAGIYQLSFYGVLGPYDVATAPDGSG